MRVWYVWYGVGGVCVGGVRVCEKGGCEGRLGWGKVVVVGELGEWGA